MAGFIDQFLKVFDILLPVFAVASLGYIWARSGRAYPTREITAFVTLVGTPCLLFSFLIKQDVPFFGLISYMGAVFALIAFVTLVSYLILPVFGGDRRALTAAFSFPNVGNIGLPVCIFAFGEAGGGTYALVYFAVSAMLMHTIGRWAHQGETNPRIILESPVLWTVLITLTLIWWEGRTGVQLTPQWILRATDLVGGMVIPVVLISLGVAISQLQIASFGRNLLLSLVRFLLGLAAAFGGIWVFGLEGVAAKIFILQTVMPIAVLNYMFAAMYDNQVKETAALVMVSNLMAVITLPVVLWFLV